MTGQERIIAMRRQGLRPACVWVSDYRCGTDDGLTVSLSSTDVPEQQDWRFLVGLTALVDGDSAERVRRITEACKAFATRVISTTYCLTGVVDTFGLPCRAVSSIEDTEGVMTWRP